eukprot:768802-Hanusia_phi.AAC.2
MPVGQPAAFAEGPGGLQGVLSHDRCLPAKFRVHEFSPSDGALLSSSHHFNARVGLIWSLIIKITEKTNGYPAAGSLGNLRSEAFVGWPGPSSSFRLYYRTQPNEGTAARRKTSSKKLKQIHLRIKLKESRGSSRFRLL